MTKPIASLLLLLSCLFLSACEKDWGIDQHGREVTAAQLQGQWLLINYWAEWCGPCRTEIPELNALAETEQGLAVLGVNFDELRGEELAQAAKALGIDFRVLSDDPAERDRTRITAKSATVTWRRHGLRQDRVVPGVP